MLQIQKGMFLQKAHSFYIMLRQFYAFYPLVSFLTKPA